MLQQWLFLCYGATEIAGCSIIIIFMLIKCRSNEVQELHDKLMEFEVSSLQMHCMSLLLNLL